MEHGLLFSDVHCDFALKQEVQIIASKPSFFHIKVTLALKTFQVIRKYFKQQKSYLQWDMIL